MPLSALDHHGEPIEPELMDWILHRTDAIFGLGPETIMLLLASLIVSAPIVAPSIYARQRLIRGRERA